MGVFTDSCHHTTITHHISAIPPVCRSQVLTSNNVFSAPMGETYALLGLDPKQTTTLEAYLQEYYSQILRKLKDLKATSKQGDYYL